MGRIRAIVIGKISLIILIVTWGQARSMGAHSLFGPVITFMILLVVFRVAQAWLRGY